MIRSYKAEGIVLSRRNIGEADKLVTLFTKQFGKRTLIAKGIRKIASRRAPHLELFSHIRIGLHQGKSLDIITEVEAINQFGFIREKLERFSIVCIALELTDKLNAENQEHWQIFQKLIQFLTLLNSPQTSREQANSTLTEYKQFLLEQLGFIPGGRVLTGQELDRIIESTIESTLKSPELLKNIRKNN